MSRFNNFKNSRTLSAAAVRDAVFAHASMATRTAGSEPSVRQTQPAAAPSIAPASNIMQKGCFIVLCAFLLSAYANEFAFRLFHDKAYISTVALVLLPLALLSTRAMFRGISLPLGKWLLAFGAWLAICAPFSVWRGGTAIELANYCFRCFILYFVICACVITVRQLKMLMFVQCAGAALVVLSCIVFGTTEEGRFSVFGSGFSFLSNANELALQLLLGTVTLVFLFVRGGIFAKVVAIGLIILSCRYMLETGSRGIFLATGATVLIMFWLSRNKVAILALALPLLALTFVSLPAHTRSRLTDISISSEDSPVFTGEDLAARGSQIQRQRLFRDSLLLTLTHPIFGVGPGEFMVAASGSHEKKGERADWRGTHNSYTQVSSEAGIPGFIFYIAVIVVSLRMNYRLYKSTGKRAGMEDYAALSYCMFLSIVVYAIATFFFHVAYSIYLPTLAGTTAAIYLAAKPVLQESLQGESNNF